MENNEYPEMQLELTFLSSDENERQKQLEILKQRREKILEEFENSEFEVNDKNFKQYWIEEKISDKIKASFLGFAIGDAMGVPVEFLSRETLEKQPITKMIGNGTHHMPEGTWSDDTSLTIATIDSIIEKNSIDYINIMTKFVDWYKKANYTATNHVFDIGISTSHGINNYLSGRYTPSKCGSTNYNDNGNGSLMRMLPIVFYSYYNNLTEDDEVELINNISSLTHAHEISRLGCKIFCDYVKYLLNGVDRFASLRKLKQKDYTKYYSKESIDLYERILSGSISSLSKDDIKSTGFVVNTLEASIWCILNTNSYEESIIKAINLGNDTDTVGAITGGMSGIIYEMNGIPKEWLNKLKKREYLEDLTNKFSTYLYKCVNKEDDLNYIK